MQTFFRWSLLLAGVYNLVWGAWVIFFPRQFWQWVSLPEPNYLQLWQCIGMIVGVYGIGYLAAARDPVRHWPVVLVGFLGKVLGPIGFLDAALRGQLPWHFGVVNIFNDLVWWTPFALILWQAWKFRSQPAA